MGGFLLTFCMTSGFMTATLWKLERECASTASIRSVHILPLGQLLFITVQLLGCV